MIWSKKKKKKYIINFELIWSFIVIINNLKMNQNFLQQVHF